MSVRYVVRGSYNLALPLTYPTNIHLVRDLAIGSLLGIAPIISLSIYNFRQISQATAGLHSNISERVESMKGNLDSIKGNLGSIEENLDIIKAEMATKEDMKNFVEEIARQHPCLRDGESVLDRWRK